MGQRTSILSSSRIRPIPLVMGTGPVPLSSSEEQQLSGAGLYLSRRGRYVRGSNFQPSEKQGKELCFRQRRYLRPQGSGSFDQRAPGRHSTVSDLPGILMAPSVHVYVTLDPTGKLLACSSPDGLEWVMRGGGPQSPAAAEHLPR